MTTPPKKNKNIEREGFSLGEMILDKSIDFVLIFVGLYAATALQRYQDEGEALEDYVQLLGDFNRELSANLEQEKSIEKDLGLISDSTPGENLGPLAAVFKGYHLQITRDGDIAHCLHQQFALAEEEHAISSQEKEKCDSLYRSFDATHGHDEKHFDFKPAVLTPFYRYEVWELYLANGVRNFRNKDLAVKVGEIYNNARLIEKMVADIETTFNDSFMSQVGRSAATDMELAEIVHDEELTHHLPEQDLQVLIKISHDLKDERFAAIESQSILSLKVERMKRTVLMMRSEIESVRVALKEEKARY